ncbi:MAG: (2Fe-2S)-binding protein [Candidatus Sumerlaeaceae bacterium]|nr:(2Fe-2S)-binding protein [Candidatus Sumerlaeaceae bacterium]
MTTNITFQLNGREKTVQAHPMARLLDVLRQDCSLTGTKEGCGEGECGACTVIIDGRAVMSCMVPVCQVHGSKVESIEGLESMGADGQTCLHLIQEAFIKCGGAQCGICTPGMIMAAVAYLRQPESAPGGVAEALEGNLCRCTGYTRIFESVKTAIDRMKTGANQSR